MLIRNASLLDGSPADVRIAHGRIAAIGRLDRAGEEALLDAEGGLLIPGLHDHHIHLPALAAKRASILCGPPEVEDEPALRERLRQPGTGWLRGIGYHESIAGMLDARTLDDMLPDRPVRIQHRSGRMWFLNSSALDILLGASTPPPGLEQVDGRYTGRLFDADRWLREALGGTPPPLADTSALLASYGITGVTEMSPANDATAAAWFATEQAEGRLRQRCLLSGTLALADARFTAMLRPGCAKLHLHEHDLPPLDEATAFIATAHDNGWPVAVHCTTETELAYTLAAFDAAGSRQGDRIEHASIAPDPLVAEMVRLELRVVTQPNFVAERGDRYLADVEPELVPVLYRLRSLASTGLVLAGGSDAPFGEPDPWAAMRAAVSRRTYKGRIVGAEEALSPEEALALFLADPADLSRQRRIAPGADADLCLLDRPWSLARTRLQARDVRATLIDGAVAWGSDL
ncbi:amidohydrolase family protein [Rhizorhabdus dicambivorans]|uniref:Hydrolase n=1 Tax=Rhizorhabdus dicambivorans TaxID=1850238 RepID=A0A2A4FVJ7_9SPHN|nr:amidohydrolase family protein [Rhizorhabdus dicambivorans]ATE66203.1 hydrolase [Rhizorhabdus dicambivorans]PCE41714.1 hydrolase [Rhizorhabdus dicambivorans]